MSIYIFSIVTNKYVTVCISESPVTPSPTDPVVIVNAPTPKPTIGGAGGAIETTEIGDGSDESVDTLEKQNESSNSNSMLFVALGIGLTFFLCLFLFLCFLKRRRKKNLKTADAVAKYFGNTDLEVNKNNGKRQQQMVLSGSNIMMTSMSGVYGENHTANNNRVKPVNGC